MRFVNDPTLDETKLCPECHELLFRDENLWLHCSTGDQECETVIFGV